MSQENGVHLYPHIGDYVLSSLGPCTSPRTRLQSGLGLVRPLEVLQFMRRRRRWFEAPLPSPRLISDERMHGFTDLWRPLDETRAVKPCNEGSLVKATDGHCDYHRPPWPCLRMHSFRRVPGELEKEDDHKDRIGLWMVVLDGILDRGDPRDACHRRLVSFNTLFSVLGRILSRARFPW